MSFDLFNSISPCCYVRRYSDLEYYPIKAHDGTLWMEAFKCLRCQYIITEDIWTTTYNLPAEKFWKIIKRLKGEIEND